MDKVKEEVERDCYICGQVKCRADCYQCRRPIDLNRVTKNGFFRVVPGWSFKPIQTAGCDQLLASRFKHNL
jgi:hypothetical protein